MDMGEELVAVKVLEVVEDMEVMVVVGVVEEELEVVAVEVGLKVVDMVQELGKVVGKDMVGVQHMAVDMLAEGEVEVVEVEVVVVVLGELVVVMEVEKEVEQEVDMEEIMEEDTEVEVEVEVVEEVVLVERMALDTVVVEEPVVDMGVGRLGVVVEVVALVEAEVVEVRMEEHMVVVLEVVKVAAMVDMSPEDSMQFNVMKELLAPLNYNNTKNKIWLRGCL